MDVCGLLGALARITGKDADAMLLQFYVEELSDIPEERLIPALRTIMRGAKRWPTVDEIRQVAGESARDPNGVAREIADKIVEGIRKYGYMAGPSRLPALQAFLGELAWALVQKLGGWNMLCETVRDDQLPTLKAQWRESALALIDRAQRGEALDAPPEVPALPVAQRRVAGGGLKIVRELMP